MSPEQVEKVMGLIEQNTVPIGNLRIINVQPGDLVVLTLRNGFRLSHAERDYISTSLSKMLPEGVKTIVLHDMEMAVLRGGADGGEATEADGVEEAGRESGEAGDEWARATADEEATELSEASDRGGEEGVEPHE